MTRREAEKKRQGPKLEFTELTIEDCEQHKADILLCNYNGFTQICDPETRSQMLRRFEDMFGESQ